MCFLLSLVFWTCMYMNILIIFLPLFQATACISTLPLPIIWNYAWHPFPWSKLYAFGLHILPHTLHFTSMGSVALVYLPKTLILGLIFVSSSQNCLWLFTTIFPSFLFRHCVYIWTALMRILPEITFYELRKDLIQYCSGFLWGQGNVRASVPVTGGAAIITSCCAFLFYLNVANRHINYVCMQLFDISMPI